MGGGTGLSLGVFVLAGNGFVGCITGSGKGPEKFCLTKKKVQKEAATKSNTFKEKVEKIKPMVSMTESQQEHQEQQRKGC